MKEKIKHHPENTNKKQWGPIAKDNSYITH